MAGARGSQGVSRRGFRRRGHGPRSHARTTRWHTGWAWTWGGTFTDLLLFDDASGAFWRHKTPSTPKDSSQGILTGVEAVCDKAGLKPSDIEVFLHGTTVATNAVLEGKGARVGLVTTQGYRQIMQIARSFVPGGLAGWIVWPKPEPLAKLEDTVEIKGRMDAQGREVRPVDDADIAAQLEVLKARGVEALTVSLINAYLNGEHELRVAALAREILPDVPLSLSHEVLPEMQEYERTLTTVANAAVRPIVGRYVRNLRGRLEAVGMKGRLALLRSDGGLMSSQKSEEHPVSLLMSGPAGGVTGALWVAKNAGLKNILTLDVGGTSTDVALIEHGEPRRVRTTEVGHLSVRASSLDVKTVGAGGGSIAYVPELTGALRVGPQSAGAEPGPAAYGKGGVLPTVTDANVVLGYLPENLLGGAFKLDREGGQDGGADHRRQAEHRADASGPRHHRHRQREHVRRAADDLGAAGLRPARLRPDGLWRRGSAASERGGAADGQLPRRLAGLPRRAVRAGRRHHADAHRDRAPRWPSASRRPRAKPRSRRCSPRWTSRCATSSPRKASPPATSRPASRSTSATPARPSRCP